MAFDWTKLQEILPEPVVPENSFTVEEFSQKYKVSRRHAQSRLRDAVTFGELRRVRVKNNYYYTITPQVKNEVQHNAGRDKPN